MILGCQKGKTKFGCLRNAGQNKCKLHKITNRVLNEQILLCYQINTTQKDKVIINTPPEVTLDIKHHTELE